MLSTSYREGKKLNKKQTQNKQKNPKRQEE
jgi:hypothetical protein